MTSPWFKLKPQRQPHQRWGSECQWQTCAVVHHCDILLVSRQTSSGREKHRHGNHPKSNNLHDQIECYVLFHILRKSRQTILRSFPTDQKSIWCHHLCSPEPSSTRPKYFRSSFCIFPAHLPTTAHVWVSAARLTLNRSLCMPWRLPWVYENSFGGPFPPLLLVDI